MKETIAVTGATGHVGANLVRMLVAEGYHVRALLRQPTSEALHGVPVEVVVGDLTDEAALQRLCFQVEVVIHTAAMISIGNIPERAVFETNVTGVANLVRVCKKQGVRRLIHFSSVDAFVMNGLSTRVDETTPLDLNSSIIYKKTKAMGEHLALQAVTPNFEVIVLAPAAIMGPFDFKPSLIGQMIIQMYSGKLPLIVPGGYRWVDVRDICQTAIKAIHQGVSGQKYILAGEWVDLKEMTNMIQPMTLRRVYRGTAPYWLAYLGVPFIGFWSKITKSQPLYTFDSLRILQSGAQHLCSAKAERTFGFVPRPFSETLTETIDWFKQNKYLS